MTTVLNDLPSPKGLPLVGNFFDVDPRRFHLILEDWCDQLGPAYTFRVGPKQILCLAYPDEINQILRDRPDTFRRRKTFETVIKEMGFNGLFSSEGENWKRQRKIVAQALNSAHLNRFFPNLARSTLRLKERWGKASKCHASVDLCKDLMRFTVDVTSELAFGIDVNTLETEGPVIQQHLDKVFPMLGRRVNMPIPLWRWFPSKKDKELIAALDAISIEINAIIARCQQRIAQDPSILESPANFLEAIIAAQHEHGDDFSDQDIYANVLTLLLAGEDTTANTIAWATNYFIDFPQYLQTAREEVEKIAGSNELPTSSAQLSQLKFIEAFANETMRLKPVAPLNGLETNIATRIGEIEVPPGTPVLALTRHCALQDQYFSNAKQFNPHRWLSNDTHLNHETSAFLPFGTGPRFCPGRNLALAEIKMCLAMLVKYFDFKRDADRKPVRESLAFTMYPANLHVEFALR
ncbi:MAG: cytochrome P450 [Gammaproteobacteria bacterium]